MKIIEFCGNPGVGKTTLVVALTKEMHQRGIKTVSLISTGMKVGFDFGDLICKVIHKYYRKKLSKKNYYFDKYKDYLEYLSRYSYTDLFKKRILSLLFFLERLKNKKIEYLFVDEGFIQNTTSYVHDRNFDEDELDYFSSFLNRCVYDKYDIHIAYCHVDQEQNVERIHKRGRPGDRFLLGDEGEMKKLINTKRDNIKMLITKVNNKSDIDIPVDSYKTCDICDLIIKSVI